MVARRGRRKTDLSTYFAVALVVFGVASLSMYSPMIHQKEAALVQELEGFATTGGTKKIKNGYEEAPADFRLAGLSCEAYGGPSDKEAKEMVYWEDIPSDR